MRTVASCSESACGAVMGFSLIEPQGAAGEECSLHSRSDCQGELQGANQRVDQSVWPQSGHLTDSVWVDPLV